MVINKYLYGVLVALMSCCVQCGHAQQVPPVEIPDFERSFEVLRNNRKIYNAYNDSITLITDHYEWVSFFKRRAVKVHRLYDTNQRIFRSINQYFTQLGDSVPESIYVYVMNECLREYVSVDMSADPFMLFAASNILEKAGKNRPSYLRSDNVVSLWKLHSYVQMWNLGGDVEYLKKAYRHGMFLMSDEAKKYPYYDYAYPQALRYMAKTMWMVFHLQSLEEYRACCAKLHAYLRRGDTDRYLTGELKEVLLNMDKTQDEALVRNVYMRDSTSIGRQEGDSLTRAVIERNLADEHLSDLSYVRTQYLRMQMGQISSETAWYNCMRKFRSMRRKVKGKRLNARQLSDFLQPFYTFFYINDVADVSLLRKKRMVNQMCLCIEMAYRHRIDQQSSTDYVRDLFHLSTYDVLVKYLSDRQLVHFINSLTVATQVTTYAHSVHVAKIADVLVRGIIRQQPELLVGLPGCESVADVRRHKNKLLHFVQHAAMYHDIGKCSIVSVVSNEYRPLFDEEFKITKRHPALGLSYLSLVPSLAQYKETTLGHHKWYNGKGGYPEDFDNTQSPVRIMIDIVTLSDCLQAATEKVARNYRYEKTFQMVMEEFWQDAGVKYNPDLVKFISDHRDVAKRLAHLIEEGWPEIYYNIYKKYYK